MFHDIFRYMGEVLNMFHDIFRYMSEVLNMFCAISVTRVKCWICSAIYPLHRWSAEYVLRYIRYTGDVLNMFCDIFQTPSILRHNSIPLQRKNQLNEYITVHNQFHAPTIPQRVPSVWRGKLQQVHSCPVKPMAHSRSMDILAWLIVELTRRVFSGLALSTIKQFTHTGVYCPQLFIHRYTSMVIFTSTGVLGSSVLG